MHKTPTSGLIWACCGGFIAHICKLWAIIGHDIQNQVENLDDTKRLNRKRVFS